MTKILVIEDEIQLRKPIKHILESQSYIVLEAENGRAGIEMARKHLPDLIICDILMPEINGYEVLETLRNDPETENMPFIFLTAKTDPTEIRKGMGLGADDYLTKPFQIKDLLDAVQARLRRRAISQKPMEELRFHLCNMLPHEFRTPLTAILGYAKFLTDEKMHLERNIIQQFAGGIYENSVRLKRIVENYLLYSQFRLYEHDSGNLTDQNEIRPWTERNIVNISRLIRDAAIDLASDYGRSSDLIMDMPNVNHSLSIKSFVRIIEEVLDNCFKFSEIGTPVRLQILIHGERLILQITDQGHGMSEAQTDRINSRNSSDGREYEQQGVGLGLAIVQLLCRLTQSQFLVESKPKKGTTVTVIFHSENLKRVEL
ncbi:MAG: hypothetical protein B6244_12580 [Candidatus Cloacimonetes bacterium 4572_55]|nr:MAG: hypothetical protein B6244_12580 [Candidatus Cloacimonetes bacterium 4572_55]